MKFLLCLAAAVCVEAIAGAATKSPTSAPTAPTPPTAPTKMPTTASPTVPPTPAVSANHVTFQSFVTECTTRDSKRNQWIAGNLQKNVFSVVQDNGNVSTIPFDSTIGAGTAGVHYDATSDVVHAVALNFSGLFDPNSAPSAQLVTVKMADNSVSAVDLAPVSGKAKTLINDLTKLPNGDVYITDSWNGDIIQVPANGTPSVWMTNVTGWQPNPYNGLMLSVNGIEQFKGTDNKQNLLVGISLRKNSLYKVDVATKNPTEVQVNSTEWATNFGIDGLRFVPGRTDLMMTVQYLDSGTKIAPLLLQSKDEWVTASVVGVDNTPAYSGAYTTLTTKGSDVWVTSTSFNGPGPSTIMKVNIPFPASPTASPTASTTAPPTSETSAASAITSPVTGLAAAFTYAAFVLLL